MSAALAASSGVHLAGIVVTHGTAPDPRVMHLCQKVFDAGLPLLMVEQNSFAIANMVHDIDLQVPQDDRDRANEAMNHVANHIDDAWMTHLVTNEGRERRLSPPAFRHQLIARAPKLPVNAWCYRKAKNHAP